MLSSPCQSKSKDPLQAQDRWGYSWVARYSSPGTILVNSNTPFSAEPGHLRLHPSENLENYLEKPQVMVTNKEKWDPESRQSSQHKDRSGFLVAALNDLDGVSEESFDLGDRRSEPEHLSGHRHTTSQRISLLYFADQLVSKVKLYLIDFGIARGHKAGEILEKPTHLTRQSGTFSRQGVCPKKLISCDSTLALPSDDVITLIYISKLGISIPILS